MNTITKKLAMLLATIFFNASQMPGITDNQTHTEFVISSSEVSGWKSLVALYGL